MATTTTTSGTTSAGSTANDKCSTLYVGNLAPGVTEQLLVEIFRPFGMCKSCKIIRDVLNRADTYAFVEFPDVRSASNALNSMNHITLLDRELKVNWATKPGTAGAVANKPFDPNRGTAIFVGELPLDMEDQQVSEAFKPFGPIYDCKIVRNPEGVSRGYAFVTYENEADAIEAIKMMDRTWLNGRSIKVNWATRKSLAKDGQGYALPKLRYDDVSKQTSPTNCTVYCGGIMQGLDDELINKHFSGFGTIVDSRVFQEKGFAFIKYDTHQAATKAIVARHGMNINNYICKCSWGKENFGTSSAVQPTTALAPATTTAAVYPGTTDASMAAYYAQYYANYAQSYNAANAAAYQNYEQYYQEYYKQYYQQYYQQQQQSQQPQSAYAPTSNPIPPPPPPPPTSNNNTNNYGNSTDSSGYDSYAGANRN